MFRKSKKKEAEDDEEVDEEFEIWVLNLVDIGETHHMKIFE